MSLKTFFGDLGHLFKSPAIAGAAELAGAAIAPLNPGIGSLVEMIGNAVYTVETSVPASTPGETKKDMAKSIINVAAPVALQVLSGVTGKAEEPDAAQVAPAIDSLIDNIVTLFNGLGIFSHKPAAPAAKPAPAPQPAAAHS